MGWGRLAGRSGVGGGGGVFREPLGGAFSGLFRGSGCHSRERKMHISSADPSHPIMGLKGTPANIRCGCLAPAGMGHIAVCLLSQKGRGQGERCTIAVENWR